MTEVAQHYLEEARRQFRGYKRLGEGAISQLKDEDLFVTLDPGSNSVAIVVKHLAGNMRSRFTDFLTSDLEKPDRHRDQEFELSSQTTRTEVMRWWESGWSCVFSAIEALRPEDVQRSVPIRGEPPHCIASHQPATRALCLSRRTDRIPRQASSLRELEVAEHSARAIGRIQPQASGRSQTRTVGASGRAGVVGFRGAKIVRFAVAILKSFECPLCPRPCSPL